MKRQFTPSAITSGKMSKILVVICTLILGWLCQQVWQKGSWQLETNILLNIHQWANPVLDQIMLSITSLCDPGFVVIIVMLTTAWFLWRRKLTEVTILTLACFGALILNEGLNDYALKVHRLSEGLKAPVNSFVA